MIVQTTTLKSKSNFNGIPDRVIPRKQNLVKGTEIKFSPFDGWTDYPIYKTLDELDPSDLTGYNKNIYVYHPWHSYSDKMGMMEYKLIGATKKKADKRVLLIVEDVDPRAIFKTIYLEINGSKAVDCGNIFPKTEENYNSVEIGSEYSGYRNSKWIKLDPKDFISLCGKVYSK